MKRYLVSLVICVLVFLATLCATLYLSCHHHHPQAMIMFIFLLCSIICSAFAYRSLQIVREVKENYEFMGSEDEAAEYLALIPPSKIELYLSSLSKENLMAEEKKYNNRYQRLEKRHELGREQKTKLLNDCNDILYYIKKIRG